VQITEGVNVEHVGKAGSQAKILYETGEHVPWITLQASSVFRVNGGRDEPHVEEGCKEINPECRDHSSYEGADWWNEEQFDDVRCGLLVLDHGRYGLKTRDQLATTGICI
jgi:hypothetical protein